MRSNRVSLGILAAVDAGKTTLSECILYHRGITERRGRVDHGDAFLDTDELEKQRGITIFSRSAVFPLGDFEVTLVDTPGHVDFSAETARSLEILDAAVLVVSGTDGVSGRTAQLWESLRSHRIPTFVFVNKTDLAGYDSAAVREGLDQLSSGILPLDPAAFPLTGEEAEAVAFTSDEALAVYEEKGAFGLDDIRSLVGRGLLFPLFAGSALNDDGVEALLSGLAALMSPAEYGESFAARVYKISRDEKGRRMTHVKITGGTLKVREMVDGEKVSEIRRYSGLRYETLAEAEAGDVCALLGPENTRVGSGLGLEEDRAGSGGKSALSYRLVLPDTVDLYGFLKDLKTIEEELPEISLSYQMEKREIRVGVMGDVHMQTLADLILRKTGIRVGFADESVSYRETVLTAAEGVGHFEPLRHYAEVHLLIEPLPAGSGIVLESACSEDVLSAQRQSAVFSALENHLLRGVLLGAPLTDVRISLLTGRDHVKHTEGGDFREATLRALRQGLRKAEGRVLEPYYRFEAEVPLVYAGRVSSELLQRSGTVEEQLTAGDRGVLKGIIPVSTVSGFRAELASLTGGTGTILYQMEGYGPCHDEAEVIAAAGYDPDRDLEDPSSSVFCHGGAAVLVPWDEVEEHMHLPLVTAERPAEEAPSGPSRRQEISLKELEAIFRMTYGSRGERKTKAKRTIRAKRTDDSNYRGSTKGLNNANGEKILIVDGYNVIFAWDELRELSESDVGSARDALTELLAEFGTYTDHRIILVFDAYRRKDSIARSEEVLGIEVVFTGENETADSYIEKYVFAHAAKERITVATSDRLEQMNVFANGATRISARELRAEIEEAGEHIRERLLAQDPQ